MEWTESGRWMRGAQEVGFEYIQELRTERSQTEGLSWESQAERFQQGKSFE